MSVSEGTRTNTRAAAAFAILLSLGLGACDGTAPSATTQIAFETQPAASVTSMLSLGVVSVASVDRSGRVVSTAQGTVSLTLSGGSAGSLIGDTRAALVDGIATFTNLAVDRVGSYQLVAQLSGDGGSATSATFAITAGPPSRLTFPGPVVAVEGQVVPAGTTLQRTTVGITDAGGNVISSASAQVSLALGSRDTLYGTTSAATVGGVASFEDLSIHRARSYTLIATAPGLRPDTSNVFVVGSGPIVAIRFVNQPLGGPAGAKLAGVYLQEYDAYDNPRTPSIIDFSDVASVNFESNPTGAVLGGYTSSLYAYGFIFDNLSVNVAGTYTLRVVDTTLGLAVVSNSFTVSP